LRDPRGLTEDEVRVELARLQSAMDWVASHNSEWKQSPGSTGVRPPPELQRLGELDPYIARATKGSLRIFRVNAVLVAGRRQLGKEIGTRDTADSGIQVRTYDWIVDASE